MNVIKGNRTSLFPKNVGKLCLMGLLFTALSGQCYAQRNGKKEGRGGKKEARGNAKVEGKGSLGENPAPVGSKGVVWYATWETAIEEAKRSGRPIFFMTAAYQCSKVPGVY